MRSWEAAREKERKVGFGQYLTCQVLLQFPSPWVVTNLLIFACIPRNCSFSMFLWAKEPAQAGAAHPWRALEVEGELRNGHRASGSFGT